MTFILYQLKCTSDELLKSVLQPNKGGKKNRGKPTTKPETVTLKETRIGTKPKYFILIEWNKKILQFEAFTFNSLKVSSCKISYQINKKKLFHNPCYEMCLISNFLQ